MKTITAFAVGLALVGALSAAPAQAQLQHTFVSSKGSDSNNCSLAAPCRHLQAALAATTAGGEIAILDTAGYNGGTTVTITQAVSIVNPGGFEAELAPPSSGIAIVINAGPSDAVSLRGLSIDGGGVANTTGIQFNTGASLTVENCVIRHMAGIFPAGIGIYFTPNTTSSLTVSNTVVSDNAVAGIYVIPSGSGAVTAVFNRVATNGNGVVGLIVNGANSTGTVNATVSDSIAARNGINGAGFLAEMQPGSAPTTLAVFHSVAANNSGYGLWAIGSGATIRVAQSLVTGNAGGWSTGNGSSVQSYGNNSIDGNASNETAPPSIALK